MPGPGMPSGLFTALLPAGHTGFIPSSISPACCSPVPPWPHTSSAARRVAGAGPYLSATVSLRMLLVAVVLNIVGLNVGKWLQNAGGVGTYVPLLMLAAIAAWSVGTRFRNAFHHRQYVAHVELGHGQLLVADRLCLYRTGTGVRHERRSARSAPDAAASRLRRRRADRPHVHCRHICILSLVPAADLDPQSGVFHAITVGSVALGSASWECLRPSW